MANLLYLCTVIFWVFIFCIYGHVLLFALAELKLPKTVQKYKPIWKIACLIPAHNEETVIGELVRSLKTQNYPQHLYKIFVVADNCTDATARIAKSNGAEVFEKPQCGGGKGAVIRFFLDQLFNELDNERFGAVCFFDADNLVSMSFLQTMNNHLCEGKKCLQGYLGTKNPRDNWVTKAIYASYLITNRLFQFSRGRLGFSSACGGTGFCITTDILKKYGWPAETLTEDLEMQIFYNLQGLSFSWVHDAVVYDEKTHSWRIALRQRTRWLIGHLNVLRKYFVQLVVKGVKTRDVRLLDQAFYLLSPIYWFSMGFLTVMWVFDFITPLGIFYLDPIQAIVMCGVMMIIYPMVGIYRETQSVRDLTLIPYMLIFAPIWIIALILAFKNLGETEWSHTPHGTPLFVD